MKLLLICALSVLTVGIAWASAPRAVPNTLDEAFAALDAMLTPPVREEFKKLPEQEATVRAHMSVGLYIRNEWFRHGGSRLPGYLHKLGARALDDMSDMVLTSYWRWLNGQPIRIEEQGACYQRWWKEQQRLKAEAKAKGETSYRMPGFHCP